MCGLDLLGTRVRFPPPPPPISKRTISAEERLAGVTWRAVTRFGLWVKNLQRWGTSNLGTSWWGEYVSSGHRTGQIQRILKKAFFENETHIRQARSGWSKSINQHRASIKNNGKGAMECSGGGFLPRKDLVKRRESYAAFLSLYPVTRVARKTRRSIFRGTFFASRDGLWISSPLKTSSGRAPSIVIWGRHSLYHSPNSRHNAVKWSNPRTTGTRFSHSYLTVLMTLSVTAMEPCFPTAPKRGFTSHLSRSSAKALPVKTGA